MRPSVAIAGGPLHVEARRAAHRGRSRRKNRANRFLVHTALNWLEGRPTLEG
jgi:hypothetical protein